MNRCAVSDQSRCILGTPRNRWAVSDQSRSILDKLDTSVSDQSRSILGTPRNRWAVSRGAPAGHMRCIVRCLACAASLNVW